MRLSHGQKSTSSPKRPEQKQSTPPSSHESGPQYTLVEIQCGLGIQRGSWCEKGGVYPGVILDRLFFSNQVVSEDRSQSTHFSLIVEQEG